MKSFRSKTDKDKENARKEAKRLAKEKAKGEAIEAKERAKKEAEETRKAREVEERARKEAKRLAKEKAKGEAIEAKERAKREAEPVERLKSGDPDAVSQMYNTNVDRVYSLVFNQVDRDHEVAQDIVQETFLAAVKSVRYFKGRSNISTWLCSIANRKVADFYRRKKRETKHRVDYSIDTEQVQNRRESTVDLVELGESREVVRQVLFRLPLHYRQVLIMKYVEGIPVSEIGTIMNRSTKSVEGLLTRARRELQTKLNE